MNLREVNRIARFFGVPVHATGLNQWYVDLLGLDDPGSGNPRDYEPATVRFLISWLLLSRFIGHSDGGSPTDGDETPPLHLMARGVVCRRVPDWSILDTEHKSGL